MVDANEVKDDRIFKFYQELPNPKWRWYKPWIKKTITIVLTIGE